VPNERQRREAERRRLKRQLQRRAEREARRRRFAVIASIAGTVVLIAVIITVVVFTGNDNSSPAAGHSPISKPPTSSAAAPSSSTTPPASEAAYPCTWTPSGTPARQVSPPPTTKPPKTGKVDLLVSTSLGPLTFQLDRSAAPCAVESFTSLAEQNYYDQTPCHRLTTSGIYVLQCGDPSGTGSGGPGYSFADELSGHEKYDRGVIAMANSGPNTNGSQFFIVYKKSQLPPSYTIFGTVTSGMKIIDKVAAAGSDNSNGQGDGKPNKPITLTSVGVVQ
jgi:peptidyl-prolyl cis-trans isomerase B (cyclophilin B)